MAFDRLRLIRACDRAGIQAEFTEVPTVAAFTRALAAGVFDVVFIDYRLTDGDGLVALARLLEDPRHADCASIMIAGDTDAAVAVEALKAGCCDYIGKSDISPASLHRAVTNAVEKASLRRQISSVLGLHDFLRQAMSRLAASADAGLRADLDRLIVAAGPGAPPDGARRLRDFLDSVAAYAAPMA